MSDKALLIDFGATRIKSATVELKTGRLTHTSSAMAPISKVQTYRLIFLCTIGFTP